MIKFISGFTILIPVYNEEKNIKNLFLEIKKNLKNYSNYEVIFINDCSKDNTLNVLESIKSENFYYYNNNKNMGQSYSLFEGVKKSSYDIIVTLDGDGQNNPKDIPLLLEKYFSSGDFKLIGGIRKKRKDSFIKIISSKIANFIRSKILNDNCPDTGCSLKVFDKSIFLMFPYFDGIHRFLPALYKGVKAKTFFIDVDHRARKYGKSNYGTISRMINGILDIFRVLKIIKNLNSKND